MRPSYLAAAVLLMLPAAARALPPAAAGVKWDIPQVEVVGVADITPDAGLEFIGTASTALRGLYRLGTGTLLASLPDPFQVPPVTYMFRDVDGDGRAEILCLLAGAPSELGSALIGMLDYGAGLAQMWPAIAVDPSVATAVAIDFMNLSAANPLVIVVSTDSRLMLVGAASGAVLYDSWADPAIPTGRTVDSVLVDDFDVDGHDDVLLTLRNPSSGIKRVFLIGASGGLSSVGDLSGAAAVKLQQSWPNPVNGSSTIRFELEQPSRVRLRIFDAAGRLVRTILDEQVTAGSHTRVWDGRDEQGRDAASGIYFYELDADGRRQSSKLVQVR